MTLQDCYVALGGDFHEVFSRLHSERMIQKFLLKFLDDTNYQLLERSLKNGDVGEAFRAAHTIKGMCQNLGFNRLLMSSSRLSDELRGGWTPAADVLFQQVSADYQQVVSVIQQFKTRNRVI